MKKNNLLGAVGVLSVALAFSAGMNLEFASLQASVSSWQDFQNRQQSNAISGNTLHVCRNGQDLKTSAKTASSIKNFLRIGDIIGTCSTNIEENIVIPPTSVFENSTQSAHNRPVEPNPNSWTSGSSSFSVKPGINQASSTMAQARTQPPAGTLILNEDGTYSVLTKTEPSDEDEVNAIYEALMSAEKDPEAYKPNGWDTQSRVNPNTHTSSATAWVPVKEEHIYAQTEPSDEDEVNAIYEALMSAEKDPEAYKPNGWDTQSRVYPGNGGSTIINADGTYTFIPHKSGTSSPASAAEKAARDELLKMLLSM